MIARPNATYRLRAERRRRRWARRFAIAASRFKKVLSSQWCRCLETADLLDLGTVEPAPALNSFFRDRRTAAAQTSEVQQYLLSQADHPGVIVMVTHQVNITGLTDIFPRSGEAVVLKVEDPQITQIGQLMPAS